MADKTFHLEIVTPRKTVVSAEVESFSAPGVMGGFQVLRSHAPMLASLKVGEIKVLGADGKEARYATSGGFVEVRDNKVVALVETAERSDEIDVDRANAAKTRAEKRLAEKKLETDIDRARAALSRAVNRLRIARRV
ncbi:MAG: F0F1 ATP synthase subunit epsilon [Bacteroidota bacterium]